MKPQHISLRICIIVFGVLSFRSFASAQDALELFHRMQNALGGPDRIAAIRDFEEDASVVAYNFEGTLVGNVRKRTRWIGPNFLRLDQAGLGDTYVLYFDGTVGWEILPERGTRKTTGIAISLEGDELTFAQKYLFGFMIESWRGLWLADRLAGYEISSPTHNTIRITQDNRSTDIALDPETWLPRKQASVPPDPGHSPTDWIDFIEWKPVEGVRFPTKRVVYRNGKKLSDWQDIRTLVNIGLQADDLNAQPSDFSPVFSDR